MKIITALSIALLLAITAGCQTLSQEPPSSETELSNTAYTGNKLLTLLSKAKERGCSSLTPIERSFIRLLIRSKYAVYPEEGVCDAGWFNAVLSNEIEKLGTGS